MPLALVHPLRCLTRHPLTRGEAQRIYAPPLREGLPLRPLIGYWLPCPACGCPGVWLASEGAPIEEGPLVALRGMVRPDKPLETFYGPAWVTSGRRQTCKGCGVMLRLDREQGAVVVGSAA